jgi:GDP-mannose 6-dehydrogenase
MKIAVFGLGYVGTVTSACLAQLGHEVIGVDVNADKVERIAAGKSPIVEKDLDELIEQGVKGGSLSATTDYATALEGTDVSLVSVGTPGLEDGFPDLTYLRRVSEDIAKHLPATGGKHVVVYRSTVLPGTVEGVAVPLLEKHSGLKAGKDFGFAFNPEFLREGAAVRDFYNPPKTVVGCNGNEAAEILTELYRDIDAPFIVTEVKTAEMVKYVDNCFHGLKVAFANEIGNICKGMGIDSHKVMDIFCMDRTLNLSPKYLKPGFAFGGSCLPKDLRATVAKSSELKLKVPVLSAILKSNEIQISRAIDLIRATGKRKIGVFGLSFKAGTDDVRESPIIPVLVILIGKGYEISVYDRHVSPERLVGANLGFVEEEIPYFSSILMRSIPEVMERSEVLVVANDNEEFRQIPKLMRPDHILLDLVRIADDVEEVNGQYIGICW